MCNMRVSGEYPCQLSVDSFEGSVYENMSSEITHSNFQHVRLHCDLTE